MVDQSDEDDLFKDSSMTFGEHLEELRSSLFKAVVALAIGFGIGLFFASWIVGWIQAPLYGALKAYYQEDAVEYLKKHLPADMHDEATLKAVNKLVYEDGLLPEERYVSPLEMLAALRQKYPGKLADLDLPVRSNGKPAVAKIDKQQVRGLTITRVDSSGGYTGMAGPLAPSTRALPNYRLLGAVVEGPGGNSIFVKFTGPAATVAANFKQFEQLLASFQVDK